MSWHEHTWEFVVSALSWLVASLALVGVLAYITYDALRTRKRRR